jgi:hypothetical protein
MAKMILTPTRAGLMCECLDCGFTDTADNSTNHNCK